MSCEKTEYNESEQSIADFIVYAIVCVIETEYEAEKMEDIKNTETISQNEFENDKESLHCDDLNL